MKPRTIAIKRPTIPLTCPERKRSPFNDKTTYGLLLLRMESPLSSVESESSNRSVARWKKRSTLRKDRNSCAITVLVKLWNLFLTRTRSFSPLSFFCFSNIFSTVSSLVIRSSFSSSCPLPLPFSLDLWFLLPLPFFILFCR